MQALYHASANLNQGRLRPRCLQANDAGAPDRRFGSERRRIVACAHGICLGTKTNARGPQLGPLDVMTDALC